MGYIVLSTIGIGLTVSGCAWFLMFLSFSQGNIYNWNFWIKLGLSSLLILTGACLQLGANQAKANQATEWYQHDNHVSAKIEHQLVDLQETQFKLARISHNNHKMLETVSLREHENTVIHQVKNNINNHLHSNARILAYGHQFDKIMGRTYESYNWETNNLFN